MEGDEGIRERRRPAAAQSSNLEADGGLAKSSTLFSRRGWVVVAVVFAGWRSSCVSLMVPCMPGRTSMPLRLAFFHYHPHHHRPRWHVQVDSNPKSVSLLRVHTASMASTTPTPASGDLHLFCPVVCSTGTRQIEWRRRKRNGRRRPIAAAVINPLLWRRRAASADE